MVGYLSILFGILLILGFPMFMVIILPTLSAIFIFQKEIFAYIVAQKMIGGVSPFPIVAVPLFIFAGDLMTEGELSTRLINLAQKFVGHIYGGLAQTLILSCLIFGAVSGSTQATVAAIGGNMYQALLDRGYKQSFVLGLIVNASDVALLIPPSIIMIVFGVVTGTSVGALFLAGIIPGILLGLSFMVYSWWWARNNKIQLAPRSTFTEILITTKKAACPLFLPIIIIGGIYSGIFTPTEAASIAVVYSIFLEMVIFRSLNAKDIYRIALKSGTTTAVVFIIVAAAEALSWLFTFAQVPQSIAQSILSLNPSPILLLFIINFVFFIALMFFAPIPTVLILTPLFYPVAMSMGISPIHLGILITLNCAIGSATPPFGVDLFTACAIFNVPFAKVIEGVPPFIVCCIITLIIVTLFPGLSLWIPKLAF